MNIGQVLETHLGWAAERLGFATVTPVFDGADEDEIAAELARAWLIDRASEQGISQISLSVSKDNYAINLYRQQGFQEYVDKGDMLLMVRTIEI